jgi:micrococcal nuclease
MSEPTAFNYRVKKIVKIIDGDTFDCILDLGFDVLLEARVRMMGIDTPESRTSNKEEKVYGLLAKEWLKKHVDDSIIISTHVDNEKGKFGRILGTVWKDGNNINEQMITEGHAVSYHGQNKDDVQAAHMANRQLLKEKGIA